MWLQFYLVLVSSGHLNYLKSVLTHSFLCRSRKLGHELGISNKFPVPPAAPPECISFDLYLILDFFISIIPPLLEEWLFYWAYFWTPKVLPGKTEMMVSFDADLILLHPLVYCTYRSVGNAFEWYLIFWLVLMIHFFIQFIYTLRAFRQSHIKDSSQDMAVF